MNASNPSARPGPVSRRQFLGTAAAASSLLILPRQVVAGVTYSVTAYVNGGRRPVKFAARYVVDDRRRISAAQSHMALRRAMFTSEVER